MNITYFIIGSTLIAFLIGYYCGIYFFGGGATKCDVYVQSLRTGYKYHASQCRLTSKGPEICIYDWYLSEFSWESVWHFENADRLIAYLMPDYARERYDCKKLPNMKNNDFTKKAK